MTMVTNEGIVDTTPKTDTPELLTVSEVARALRVDDTTVRRWVKQGALDAVVLPHQKDRQAYRIKRAALDKILDSGAIS